MTTKTQITSQSQTDVGYETSRFALGVGIFMAALVGLWGMACLIGALVSTGPINVVKNYFLAMIG